MDEGGPFEGEVEEEEEDFAEKEKGLGGECSEDNDEREEEKVNVEKEEGVPEPWGGDREEEEEEGSLGGEETETAWGWARGERAKDEGREGVRKKPGDDATREGKAGGGGRADG